MGTAPPTSHHQGDIWKMVHSIKFLIVLIISRSECVFTFFMKTNSRANIVFLIEFVGFSRAGVIFLFSKAEHQPEPEPEREEGSSEGKGDHQAAGKSVETQRR